MEIYLPSFTDDELLRYAGVHATTDLEKELLARIETLCADSHPKNPRDYSDVGRSDHDEES